MTFLIFELPFNIPDPDPIGEIIAVINNKSPHKDKFASTSVQSDSNDNETKSDTSTSTITKVSTEENDILDLKDDVMEAAEELFEPASIFQPNPENSEILELTDYDLIITGSTTKDLNITEAKDSKSTASSTQE